MIGLRGQSGLTLVELLVTMLLGVILSGAAAGAYLAAKRHYLYDEQLSRLQENGRYASRLLARELAMAGFFGGLASTADLAAAAVVRDCAAADWALEPGGPLDMVDGHVPGSAPRSLTGREYTCIDPAVVAGGTDLLAVKRTAATAAVRRGVAAPTLTASDVESWFLRTTDGTAPLWEQWRPADFTTPMNPSLDFWKASARVFFVRSYSQEAGDGVPALCMAVLAGDAMTTRCLVEGVEDLQVEIGIDTDGDGIADRYRARPTGPELATAVSARVYLLLRSLTPLPGHSDDGAYALGTRSSGPALDAYLRRVVFATVVLRNLTRPAL